MDDAVEIAQGGPPEAEVLDGSTDAGQSDHVALREVVLDEDQRAVEIVLDEALRAETDRDSRDTQSGDRRADVGAELVEDDEPSDRDDQEAEDVDRQRVDRVDPLLDLNRRELLGGPFARLAFHEGLDDPVDEHPRRGQRDEGHEDDEDDRPDGGSPRLGQIAPGPGREVGHGR